MAWCPFPSDISALIWLWKLGKTFYWSFWCATRNFACATRPIRCAYEELLCGAHQNYRTPRAGAGARISRNIWMHLSKFTLDMHGDHLRPSFFAAQTNSSHASLVGKWRGHLVFPTTPHTMAPTFLCCSKGWKSSLRAARRSQSERERGWCNFCGFFLSLCAQLARGACPAWDKTSQIWAFLRWNSKGEQHSR
jgi:hypothetical protein